MKNVKQKEYKHFHTDLIGKFSFLQAYFLSHPHGLGGRREANHVVQPLPPITRPSPHPPHLKPFQLKVVFIN